jgi:predicted dehydrogenase
MTPTGLRMGVLGAANIARQFIAGVADSSLVNVLAVASRDTVKGEAFAREVGVARSHGSYEELLADREIDAVYNPLPNSLHAEWSIRAAEAGKHVLCEKQLLRDGTIGQLRHIQATFGFTVASANNIRLIATLGGGARLDAGSYPTSLVRVVAGERPAVVYATAQWLSEGVDKTIAATLEFPSGVIAQIFCSFATASHRHAVIAGDQGAIMTNYFNHSPPRTKLALQIKRSREPTAPYETLDLPGGDGFLAEAESFAHLVAGRPERWTGVTPEETTDIMLTLDAMAESALAGRPVEVGR